MSDGSNNLSERWNSEKDERNKEMLTGQWYIT